VKFADYKDFISVSKSDNKLETLSEANNMYRTLVSMFSLIFLTFGFQKLACKWEFLRNNQAIIILTLLFFLFLISYRKQTNYITKRINASK
jgi:C4-dicarboxylate transporter